MNFVHSLILAVSMMVGHHSCHERTLLALDVGNGAAVLNIARGSARFQIQSYFEQGRRRIYFHRPSTVRYACWPEGSVLLVNGHPATLPEAVEVLEVAGSQMRAVVEEVFRGRR